MGTTVKSKDKLPVHVLADEKHTKLKGKKVFVPTTVAGGCILGASVVSTASADDLEKGYGDLAVEVRELDPLYSPETVCADGWQRTCDAWARLFSPITSPHRGSRLPSDGSGSTSRSATHDGPAPASGSTTRPGLEIINPNTLITKDFLEHGPIQEKIGFPPVGPVGKYLTGRRPRKEHRETCISIQP